VRDRERRRETILLVRALVILVFVCAVVVVRTILV
jgi:hypothetical protein